MFIGKPGDLREIRNAEPGFKLDTDTNVTTHKTLSGAVTSTSRPKKPRGWSASWPWLNDSEADWLRDLARGVYGDAVVYAIDPSTRNYLAPRQSVGKGDLDQWELGNNVDNDLTQGSNGVQWHRNVTPANLNYMHPWYFAWPVMPGMNVTFSHELSDSESSLIWYDADGLDIQTDLASTTSITRAAPDGSVYVRPVIHSDVTGTVNVPRAALAYEPSIPEPWPNGEHTGALIITSHDESIALLPYRTPSMEFVEAV